MLGFPSLRAADRKSPDVTQARVSQSLRFSEKDEKALGTRMTPTAKVGRGPSPGFHETASILFF
jgi:hypothetical protein